MQDYKADFIEFLLATQALKFGDFTLKSGRRSPFFLNMGSFTTGAELKKLSGFYASAINEKIGLDFDILFGPAYKGIPLAVSTAMSIYDLYAKEVRYSSNRKEIKDHGDTGIFLGERLDRELKVVIVEDVTTSGKSIEETFPIITNNKNVKISGMMVSVDRKERGNRHDMTALDEIQSLYGFNAYSIVDMKEILEYLTDKSYLGKYKLDSDLIDRIDEYYRLYGVE